MTPRLYKTTVGDSNFTHLGLGWFTQFGTPRTVDGTPMVAIHGVLVPAKDWFSSEADSMRAAAARLDELGNRLFAQADRMRGEATAKEVPHATV